LEPCGRDKGTRGDIAAQHAGREIAASQAQRAGQRYYSAMRMGSRRVLMVSLCLAGALHVTCLLLNLPDAPVFYSGDGGMKYLMSKQFARGQVSAALELPLAEEAAGLWKQGLYPFAPPFVYAVNGRSVVSFPLYFPLATAPFEALLGWRGLYVLPVAGVLCLWGWMAVVFTRLLSAKLALGAALASLIVASPLTIYAGMYWEHSLAAFAAALSLFLVFPATKAPSKSHDLLALGCGALAGGAVFMRPEAFVCAAAAACVSAVCMGREKRRDVAWFSMGFSLLVGVLLLSNLFLYGDVLGLHAAQVTTERLGAFVFAKRALYRTLVLSGEALLTWPEVFFLLASLPLLLRRASVQRRELVACFWVIGVTLPIIALIVPNTGGKQWGPRYLLVLLPWGCALVGLVIDAILQDRRRLARVFLVLVLPACLALGALTNVWFGTRQLARDYQSRILPALKTIEKQPQHYLLVPNQWPAQELAALADSRVFLLVRTADDLRRARALLRQRGVESALFVSFKNARPPEGSPSEEIPQESDYVVRLLRF
jgi:hypothetical protein